MENSPLRFPTAIPSNINSELNSMPTVRKVGLTWLSEVFLSSCLRSVPSSADGKKAALFDRLVLAKASLCCFMLAAAENGCISGGSTELVRREPSLGGVPHDATSGGVGHATSPGSGDSDFRPPSVKLIKK